MRSDADEAYVQSLASAVDTRVCALKGTRLVATQADVVLAALQLADELHHEKQRRQDLKQKVGERARRILDSLAQLAPPAIEGP